MLSLKQVLHGYFYVCTSFPYQLIHQAIAAGVGPVGGKLSRFQIIYEKELLHKPLVEAKEGVADGNVFKAEKLETDLVTTDTLMLEPENGAVHDALARISGEAFADSGVETELQETGKEQVRKERRRGLLLKTNLLYDAVTVPNVGLEGKLGTGWSVGAKWM